MSDEERKSGLSRPLTDRPMSRRRALLTMAGAAAGGYLAYRGIKTLDNCLGDPYYDYLPMGDQSYTVRQQDVNAEYGRLYEQMAQAQAKAHREGKRLAIVMGEHHYDSLSHLHSFIIADIASRLGIKDALIEQEKEGFSKLTENIASIRNSEASIIDSKMRYVDTLRPMLEEYKDIRDKTDQLEFFIHVASSLSHSADNDLDIKRTRHKKYDEQEKANNFCFFYSTGMKLHCGDPQRNDENGVERDRYDPVVEQAMANAVAEQPKDCIACFGSNHMPALVHILSKNRDIELLAFEVSNRKAVPTEKAGNARRRRPEQNEALRSQGLLHRVVIDGSPTSFSDMTEMVLRASISHRMQNHEYDVKPPIDPRFGDLLLSMIPPLKEEYHRSAAKNIYIHH